MIFSTEWAHFKWDSCDLHLFCVSDDTDNGYGVEFVNNLKIGKHVTVVLYNDYLIVSNKQFLPFNLFLYKLRTFSKTKSIDNFNKTWLVACNNRTLV